jgi:phospholipase C
MYRRPVAAFSLTALLAACSSGGGSVPQASLPVFRAGDPGMVRPATAWRGAREPESRFRSASGVIQHVVIVVQENRTFDNLFQGYPGANTASSGLISNGTTIPLTSESLSEQFDIYHQFRNAIEDMDGGKMDSFDLETIEGTCGKIPCPQYPSYEYVPQTQTKRYFNMAKQYVLADNFFPSDEDGSFVSHQYLIAAQANETYGLPGVTPWGCDGKGELKTLDTDTIPGTPTNNEISDCFPDPYETLADEIDASQTSPPLTWHYYSAPTTDLGYVWSAYDSVQHIREGQDWSADVTLSAKQFPLDVKAGHLASVTWVTPSLANSDHPGSLSLTGPAWVAKCVNSVGFSPFWKSTVVFILWDDWGGWYDHVPPPVLDFDGLGIRTPLMVISPYALKSSVAHTEYEFGSILAFVEQNFNLAPMAASDARANPFAGGDVFDFTQKPRKFVEL